MVDTVFCDNNTGICQQTSIDHAGMSNEQTIAVEEEFGDIDKKFDDSKCTEISALLTKGICSEKSFNHADLCNE